MKVKEKIAIYGVMVFLLITPTALPQDDHDNTSTNHLKAAFIIRFAEYIEWPPNSTINDDHTPVTIGVIGDSPLFSLLIQNTKNVKIMGKKIIVISISNPSDITECNIIFISKIPQKDLKQILSEADQHPILTVGDTRDYEKMGVIINLFETGDHVRFNINKLAAQRNGIVLSSKIMRLARVVIR